MHMTSNETDETYYNVDREPRGIPVSTMKEYLQRMEQDHSTYKEEFEVCPLNTLFF